MLPVALVPIFCIARTNQSIGKSKRGVVLWLYSWLGSGRKLALQYTKLLDAETEHYNRAGYTIMIPASAIAHLEASIAALDTVPCIGLTVMGLEGLIDEHADNEGFSCH